MAVSAGGAGIAQNGFLFEQRSMPSVVFEVYVMYILYIKRTVNISDAV